MAVEAPNSKKSFLIYLDDMESVNLLSDEQAGKLFKSLFSYTVDGEVTEFTKEEGLTKMLYFQVVNKIKRDTIKWLDKSATNKENAKKGGIAKRENRIKRELEQANTDSNEVKRIKY